MKQVPFEYVDCAKCADFEGRLVEANARIWEVETQIKVTERQLAEAEEKIEAVRREAQDWMDSERAWYCRGKLDAILGEKGA